MSLSCSLLPTLTCQGQLCSASGEEILRGVCALLLDIRKVDAHRMNFCLFPFKDEVMDSSEMTLAGYVEVVHPTGKALIMSGFFLLPQNMFIH